LNKKLAEILGMHCGDGCISITPRYKEYALCGDITEEKEYYKKRVVPLFNEIIALPLLKNKIKAKKYPKMGVYGFLLFKKEIVEYFIKLGLSAGSKTNQGIPKIVKDSNIKCKKAFLRGLFDTDGSIYFQKNYSIKISKHKRPIIKIGTTSRKLKEDIKELCKELKYTIMEKKAYKGARDKNKVYELVIYKKKDIIRWIKEIEFRNPKHITKIEIWKKLGYCPPNTTYKQRLMMLKSTPCDT
jgi:intein/homing endonuclease